MRLAIYPQTYATDNEVDGVEEGERHHLVPGKAPSVGKHHEARYISADIRHQEVLQFIPDQQRLVTVAPGNELHEHPDHDEAQLDVHGEGKELEKKPCHGGFQYAFDDTQSAHGFSFLLLHEHPDHDEAQLDVHGEGKELEKKPCHGGFQYAFDDTQSAHGFSFLFYNAALADTG